MAAVRGTGQGLLFTDETVVYSPGQFVSNVTMAMDPGIADAQVGRDIA
jgi:hypothetical protein